MVCWVIIVVLRSFFVPSFHCVSYFRFLIQNARCTRFGKIRTNGAVFVGSFSLVIFLAEGFGCCQMICVFLSDSRQVFVQCQRFPFVFCSEVVMSFHDFFDYFSLLLKLIQIKLLFNDCLILSSLLLLYVILNTFFWSCDCVYHDLFLNPDYSFCNKISCVTVNIFVLPLNLIPWHLPPAVLRTISYTDFPL